MEVIAYYRTFKGRNAGKVQVTNYCELRDDGSVRIVDLGRKQMKIINSLGSKPYQLRESNKKEFQEALEKFMRM